VTTEQLVGFGERARCVVAPSHLQFSLASYRGISDRVRYDDAFASPYRGGRFVFGVGSSWPHDFRFFVGFFSSSLEDLEDSGDVGVNSEVSAKEIVAGGP